MRHGTLRTPATDLRIYSLSLQLHTYLLVGTLQANLIGVVHNRFIRAFRRQRYKQAIRIVPLLYSGPKMLTQSRSTSRLGPMTWAWTIGSEASWSSPKAKSLHLAQTPSNSS